MDIKKIRRNIKFVTIFLFFIGALSIALNLLSFMEYSQSLSQADISHQSIPFLDSILFAASLLSFNDTGPVAIFNWSPFFALIAAAIYGLLTKIN